LVVYSTSASGLAILISGHLNKSRGKAMDLKFARCLGAAAIITGMTGAPIAARAADPGLGSPLAEGIRGQFRPGPIEPYRDEHGRAVRGIENTLATPYWSGYAIANYQTGLYYTSAAATWQVPSISYGPTSGTTNGYEYNAMWVGIDGFCEDAGCSAVSQTLIQLGTNQQVSASGAQSAYAWYELYPATSNSIPYPVKVGDIITASLQCTANCIPNETQIWQLSMTNETQGWIWSQTFSFATSLLSAEWIVEAPYFGGFVPLANYHQETFDPVVANGANPNLSLSINGIQMITAWGQTSNPSDPANGDWFSTCYGTGTAFTPCTAGSFAGSGSAPAPTVMLTADPTSITAAQSSKLTWSSTNAVSCAGSGFSASGIAGSTIVYPTATTTYSVICSGNAGSATASATVKVSNNSRTCHGHKC
jgi:hypothetical protein